MIKKWMCLLWTCLVILFMPWGQAAASAVEASIEGEINDATAYHVEQVLKEARVRKADAVVLSVNTPGGEVAAAVRIRDSILASPVPVVTYVNPRAWSAGALISLAGHKLYMAPGSSIGAAEPIPATEKTISAIRSEFRATASRTGRDEEAAAAMVDSTLGYPPYAEKGQILSLTAEQALQIHLSDGTEDSVPAVLERAGFSSEDVTYMEEETSVKLLKILRHPVTEGILAAVIFLSIMAEIKTAGFSGGGLVAALAGILLIGSRWYAGDQQIAELLLYFGGMALIFVDILFLATGAAAAAGFVSVAAGLYFTFGADASALAVLAGGLVAALIAFFFLAEHLSESRLWKRVSLSTRLTSDRGYVSSSKDFSSYVGKKGIVQSGLRPTGKVLFDGEVLDVVADGEFIEKGTEVQIIRAEGSRLVVRPVV